MIEFINNSPIITAALVSGSISLCITLIQNLFLMGKYRRDEKSDFNTTLSEKLEKAYSPLFMWSSKYKNDEYLINDELLKVVGNYSHLLSKSILNYIKNLHDIEIKLRSNNSNNAFTKREHAHLKSLLLTQLDSEFFKLQSINDNNFNSYSKLYTRRWYMRVFRNFVAMCITITLLFYSFMLFGYIITYINNVVSTPVSNNIVLNTFFNLIAFISVLTPMLFIPYLILSYSEKLVQPISRLRRLYSIYHIVPETGLYKCRVCGKEKKFVKYSRFPECNNHENRCNKIKSAIFAYHWKRS